jgi:hypothetical protein
MTTTKEEAVDNMMRISAAKAASEGKHGVIFPLRITIPDIIEDSYGIQLIGSVLNFGIYILIKTCDDMDKLFNDLTKDIHGYYKTKAIFTTNDLIIAKNNRIIV